MQIKERDPAETLLDQNTANNGEKLIYDIIVFSHLRWDFIYHRPRHLFSRISKRYKTLFVEAPIYNESREEISFKVEIITPGLSVLKPRVNSMDAIQKILQRLSVEKVKYVWFYSPAFLNLLNFISTDCVIYDCTNTPFLHREAYLKRKEKKLLKIADVVITDGFSLCKEKLKNRDDVYWYPNSVDYKHFAKARKKLVPPKDIQKISRPIVGYIGIIDERIDMQLLQKAAELMPRHHFVLIGPIDKIDISDLSKADNIFYLGRKDYNRLPYYIGMFDYAMIPYVSNERTRFMNPIQTLEYMAAGKPIISTRIIDIAEHYGFCLPIIDTPNDFKRAIDKLESSSSKVRNSKYHAVLNRTSWDYTASEILKLMELKGK